MPELPEVETIRRGLEKAILHSPIAKVEVRLPKLVSIGAATVGNIRKNSKKTSRKFAALLRNKKFRAVKRRGKILILELSGSVFLLVHLKMSGQLIYAQKSELPKEAKIFNSPDSRREKLPHQYTHVIFTFKNGDKLFYNDLRQFGYLRLVHDDEMAKVKEFAEYGPEALKKDFTPLQGSAAGFTFQYFKTQAKSRAVSVKQFLMDPKIVAGIGNIYSDEILFRAKVKPRRKVGGLSQPELKAVYRCIAPVLRQAVRDQGSSVGDFFKIDGSEGRYGKQHKVYGRAGQKCKKCGTIIEKIKLGGRTGSYCPKCQY